MTKKQRKEIAIMWSAAIISLANYEEIYALLDQEGADTIRQECYALGERILGQRPSITSLPAIIDHVLQNK